jgi:hypothetical protein
MDEHVEGLASGVGWVSLGMGLALTLTPRRSAGFLEWGEREGLSRVIGASDLVVGTGLLVDRARARWMLARVLLNAVLALVYAGILKGGTPRPGRAGGWLGLMTALTAFDYALSRRLRPS